MVDEFQDTNYAQNEMAMLLAGDKQNITVVGDDDQSIYRWRGAAVANMMQFRSHFPKAKIVTLTKNYRSTQTILDAAYQLIQHNNPDRLEVKEKINKRLISDKTTIISNISSVIPELHSRTQTDESITFSYTTKPEEEAEKVAKIIREEVKKTKRPYNDFALLVRANDHALPFQRALEHIRIPYQFLGPGHLFQQEEIKDLIAYLHALANFEDTASLYRVITLPIFDLETRDVAAILNFSKRLNLCLFESMERVDEATLTSNGKEKIKRIVHMMKRHLEKVPRETAGQILYYFFEDSGLLGYYLDPRSARTEKEAQNIAKFFEKLQSFAANREDASVFAVVDWIDLSMELGESPLSAEIDWTQHNAVNILTVHSSKGLEFPVVFMVNLVKERFPSRERREQIPIPQNLIKEVLPEGDYHIQEERRLFYVGMTRARECLFFTGAKFYGDAKREKKLSPFIEEALGKDYFEKMIDKEKTKNTQLSLLDLFPSPQQPESIIQPAAKPVTYLSYSQIQLFDMCPLHYKLRYLLKVPTPVSASQSFGTSIHAVLRDFYQRHISGAPMKIK